MRLTTAEGSGDKPRVLIINPNSITGFTETMRQNLQSNEVYLDFYTAPDTVPHGLNGSEDCAISAAGCLAELKPVLDRWDAFVVACFSAHPLVTVLREVTSSPVISILESPLLLGSNLGGRVGIITTSRRWELLLSRDVAAVGLANLNAAGVVSSGMKTSELHDLPIEEVRRALGEVSRDRLVKERQADVIVLGCAGMAGLEDAISQACQGVVVLDPVKCGLEMATSLVRLKVKTSKIGIYGAI